MGGGALGLGDDLGFGGKKQAVGLGGGALGLGMLWGWEDKSWEEEVLGLGRGALGLGGGNSWVGITKPLGLKRGSEVEV